MRVAVWIIIASIAVVVSSSLTAAQHEFPATATIRGENIWLRVDPAEDTEIVGYLQRGDQIRVTAEATAADGDAFYPVEVVGTGETGWIRDLAVDPRTLTPIDALPEVVVEAPPADQLAAQEPGAGEKPKREKPKRQPKEAASPLP